MKIIFSGGGTLGSVTPLLAISDMALSSNPETVCLWIGTKDGPEKNMVLAHGMVFFGISSGKIRRYFSWQNFTDAFRLVYGFFQSLSILRRERPDVCVAAGGFVSVPVHLAAWILGIPTWVHQQDVDVGLANRIMSRFAAHVTTALQKSVDDFLLKKNVRWIGNPVRSEIFQGQIQRAREVFKITSNLPVVLVLGGGTGSIRVNDLLMQAVPHLQNVCEIIHLTGKDRPQEGAAKAMEMFPNYHAYQFLIDEMKDAYALSEVVVARGGFGTLSEIAALRKPAIIIPKAGHQEDNVEFFASAGAVEYVHEVTDDGFLLAKRIMQVLNDKNKQRLMAEELAAILPVARKEDIMNILNDVIK